MNEADLWLINHPSLSMLIHIIQLFIAALAGITFPFIFMNWLTNFSSWREYQRAKKRTPKEFQERLRQLKGE